MVTRTHSRSKNCATVRGLLRHFVVVTVLLLSTGCARHTFEAAQRDDTIDSYKKFIRENPTDPYVEPAGARLAELEFEAAKKAHDALAYKRFIEEFPDSSQASSARSLLEGLRFNAAMERGSISALKQFLSDHPEGAHAGDARAKLGELELAQASSAKDSKSLEEIAKQYPDDARGAEARVRLDAQRFEEAKAKGSTALFRYLAEFPAGSQREQAQVLLLSYKLDGLLFSDLIEQARAEADRNPLSPQLTDLTARFADAEARRAVLRARDEKVQAALPGHYLRSVDDLEKSLAAPDPLDRWLAAQELGFHISVRAIDPLLNAFRNARNAELRHQSFLSLRRLFSALPPAIAEYELSSRLESLRATSATAETALVLAVLIDLGGKLEAASAEYQKAYSPENPEPTVLRRWMQIREDRKQWFSAAVAARQLSGWAGQTLKAEDVKSGQTIPVTVVRNVCAAAEASRAAVETITKARGQRTEFPEDLISFELEAKEVSRLAEAMLKDAELRLHTQDRHAKSCRDPSLSQRIEFAEKARLGQVLTVNPTKDASSRLLLELLAARDPSPEVRKAARTALDKSSM